MFALVIAVAEKIGLKSRRDEPELVPSLVPATLADELAARGINRILLEKVRLYQRRYLREEQASGRAGSEAEWDTSLFEHYGGVIPNDVRGAVGRAKTIPGAEVFIEHFYADPFVFVLRYRSGQREVVCIGYWHAPGFEP